MGNYIYAYPSSRKYYTYPPRAPDDSGITCRCVITPSFADLFFKLEDTFKNGLLPIPIKNRRHFNALGAEARAGRKVEVDLLKYTIKDASGNVICSFDEEEFWLKCRAVKGRDEPDWIHVPGAQPGLYLDDDDDNDNGGPSDAERPEDLTRAIGGGKLRDSFDTATCPRLGGDVAGADLERALELAFKSWPLAVQGRVKYPPLRPVQRAIKEDIKRAEDLKAARPRRRFPTPYPSKIEIQQGYPTADDVPVEKGELDSGKAAKTKATQSCFSLSAIKDCIMGMLCRSKSKPKGEGQQPVLLEPQDGGILEEKQYEGVSALDEDKDKVVVSVEPVEPSSSENSGEEWDEEEPEIQPSSWFDRNPEYAPRLPPGGLPWESGSQALSSWRLSSLRQQLDPKYQPSSEFDHANGYIPGYTCWPPLPLQMIGPRQQPQDGGVVEEEKPHEGISALGEDKGKGKAVASVEPVAPVEPVEPVEPSSSGSSSGKDWDDGRPKVQMSRLFYPNTGYTRWPPLPSKIRLDPPQPPQDGGVVEEEKPQEGTSALGEDKGKGKEAVASAEPVEPTSPESSSGRAPGEKWPSSWFERNPEYAPPGSCPSRLAWEKANPDWATRPPPPRERPLRDLPDGHVMFFPGVGQVRIKRSQQPQDGGTVEPSSSESSNGKRWDECAGVRSFCPHPSWHARQRHRPPLPLSAPDGSPGWYIDDEGQIRRIRAPGFSKGG